MADTTSPDLLGRLAAHRLLGGAPPGEHAWLVAHGTLQRYPAGTVLVAKGAQAHEMTILFSGRLVIRADRGAGAHKVFEWSGGDVGGVLPYSRGASPPSDAVIEEDAEALVLPGTLLPELTRECPHVTASLVHAMLDRARLFRASELRDEKLISLGRLAAGLAHELNNPASAAVRSAALLADTLARADDAAVQLGAARLDDRQLEVLAQVRRHCRSRVSRLGLSPVARADREDEIATWLQRHGASESCAAPLAETAITLEALDRLAAEVRGPALDAALRWIAAGCFLRTLAGEIHLSTSRINELVGSVKGFTFMDHAPTPEPVDIRQGIEDTFTMLSAKVRAAGAEISLQLPADLPPAHAVGAELNQVWMNLFDNALDAIGPGGHVTVTAGVERGRLVVTVRDDGPGIPPAVLGRIFEPFFTTKDVGKGTGLGLDVVRRILQRHGGEVEVESQPGDTRFRVALPTAG